MTLLEWIQDLFSKDIVKAEKIPSLLVRKYLELGTVGFANKQMLAGAKGTVSILGQNFKAENVGSGTISRNEKVYVVRVRETDPIELEVIGELSSINLAVDNVGLATEANLTLLKGLTDDIKTLTTTTQTYINTLKDRVYLKDSTTANFASIVTIGVWKLMRVLPPLTSVAQKGGTNIGTSVTLIRASSSSRVKGCQLKCESATTVYIGGAGVTTSNGYPLAQNAELLYLAQDAIYGIVGAGTGLIKYLEYVI